ncbi:Cpg1 family polymorphic protein [Anaplasma marginale]|uniref:Uncharacterized protein n=3 Tax=Anaplasma marginale TaxID=770 RepID=B9KI42_ANAMF|nr:Conserved hypothetical protein [Anaplasma marginale str. Florida]
MPKRFIDATETHLIELLQTTMKQHNPWTGLKGKAVGLLRDITIPKPQDAHNLSVFVTEDFLSKIAGTYEREHVGGAFMTVLSLADEEVREHYLRPNRSQTFARMLIEFRNALKAGHIEGSLSDLSTFTDFVEKIVNQSVGGITYEQGVVIDTMDDTIPKEGDPTPMERALNDKKGVKLKKKKAESQTAGMYLGSGGSSGNREDAAKSAVEILIGKDYRLLSPDWLIMRSLAIAYLLKRKEMGLPVEERCPDEEDLEAMFHQERKCAALLYGCVLLSTYVEEIRQEAIRAYEKANPKVSKILKMCKKISEHSGKVLVAYTSFMAASLIATLASGGVGPAAVCGAALGYTAAAGSLALSAPQLGLLAAQGVKSLGKTLGITAAEGAAATAAAGAAVESTTAAATATAAEVARFTSPVALPATIMQTLMMYITFPRIMFSGYEGEWIRKYTESDGGKKEFKPPSMWSPLVASMGIKLMMNTMLGFTPHIEYKPLTTALGWSLYRLYLPLSLIEQPSKVRNAYEVAIAATSRKDVSNFPYSTKTTILCCLVGLAVELALHAAVGTMPTAVSQALNFLVKTARIGAWIGPIIHARRHGNPVYTREFEQVFWTDGFKALTAPPILLLFEIASSSPTFNTAVLAGDILISVIPDVICGNKLGALNVTAGKIVALESLMRTALSQKSLLELSVAMAVQEEPSAAQEHLQTLLEKHFGKDQYKDLGLDIKLDEDGTRNLSLEAERKWRAVIENAVSSDAEDGEVNLSADQVQDLIRELAEVYSKSDTNKGANNSDEETVLRALEGQHPFLAVLRGSELTKEQKAAMKASAEKLSKLDADTQKRINKALDDFEEEYHNRLIATMTDKQREMLAQAVDQLLDNIKLPDALTRQQKNDLKKSVESFRDRVRAWDGKKDPWYGAASDLNMSDLNEILEDPKRYNEFLNFFGTDEAVFDPFGPSAFDAQFTDAGAPSKYSEFFGKGEKLVGSSSTQQRTTPKPAAGKAQPAKNAQAGSSSKKYVEAEGELITGGGKGKAAPATKQQASNSAPKPATVWEELVRQILEQDDTEREEAIAALLKGESPQQSAQRGESAQEEYAAAYSAPPGQVGVAPSMQQAAYTPDSTIADDADDKEIAALFKALLSMPKKLQGRSDDEIQEYMNALFGAPPKSSAQQGASSAQGAAAQTPLASHGGDVGGGGDDIAVMNSSELRDFFGGASSKKAGTVFEYSDSQKPTQKSGTAGLRQPQTITSAGIDEYNEALLEIDNLPKKHPGVSLKNLKPKDQKVQDDGGGGESVEFFFGEDGSLNPVTSSTYDNLESVFAPDFVYPSAETPKKSRPMAAARPKTAPAAEAEYGEQSRMTARAGFGALAGDDDADIDIDPASKDDPMFEMYARCLAQRGGNNCVPPSDRARGKGAKASRGGARAPDVEAEIDDAQLPYAAQSAQRLPQKTVTRPAGKVTLDQLWDDNLGAGPSGIMTGSSAIQPEHRSNHRK